MQVRVITGSSDGTVQIFDRISSQILQVFQPKSIGTIVELTSVGDMLSADSSVLASVAALPNVHCPSIYTVQVQLLHTLANSMLIVPRGQRAFVIHVEGTVLQTFQIKLQQKQVTDIVAITVSVLLISCNTFVFACCYAANPMHFAIIFASATR